MVMVKKLQRSPELTARISRNEHAVWTVCTRARGALDVDPCLAYPAAKKLLAQALDALCVLMAQVDMDPAAEKAKVQRRMDRLAAVEREIAQAKANAAEVSHGLE
jgi:hypothetical protein